MYISETNLFWFVHRLEMLCTKNYKDQQSALMTSTPLRTIFFWKMVILKKFLHRSLSIKSAMHGPEKCFTYLKLSWTTRPPPHKKKPTRLFLTGHCCWTTKVWVVFLPFFYHQGFLFKRNRFTHFVYYLESSMFQPI